MNLSSLLIDISQKIGEKLKSTDQTLHGALNNNWIVKDEEEKKYVLRIQKESPLQIPLIRAEYEGIGYVKNGKEYRFRSIEEQASFTRRCIHNNIPTPKIRYFDNNVMLRDFVEGIPLVEFLHQKDSSAMIKNHLSNIIHAHKKGIILGDRWGPNEIVTLQNTLTYIDFDIELTARDAKEFEISQILYHCILPSGNRKAALHCVEELIASEEFVPYEKNVVAGFLRGHLGYFAKRKVYCGADPQSIESEINDIISAILAFRRR